jgi:hypothetical protein
VTRYVPTRALKSIRFDVGSRSSPSGSSCHSSLNQDGTTMSVGVNFGPAVGLRLITAGCAVGSVQSAYQETNDSRKEVRTAFDGAMHGAWHVGGNNVPGVYSNANRASA